MICSKFRKVVNVHTEKIAIKCEEQSLTYMQLDKKSDTIASNLISMGIVANDIVAIWMERSIEYVATILGILKAGAAYLPLELSLPESRIQYIINDCKPKFIAISDETELFTENVTVLKCDSISNVIETHIKTLESKSSDLTYVIYTSGSSGVPKGVMVEQQSLFSLIDNSPIKSTDSDVWTLFHSFSFDFSVWEIFGALLTGATLVIVSDEYRRNPRKFLKLLQDEHVTILNQTPSAFYSLLSQFDDKPDNLSLRYIVFGGEQLNPARLRGWAEKHNDVSLVNMFGITETTVHVTAKALNSEDLISGTSNIGKPLPHMTIRLLDNELQPIADNKVGEIFVGGAGVARGYINNPKLTADRFITAANGERLYRSGDLARYLPNGDLEYVGRLDTQVKLHGYRIELGEIETVMKRSGLVEEAVALLKNLENGFHICVFYSTVFGTDTEERLRKHIDESLPEYMRPMYYMKLDEFPVNENGKIDRAALNVLAIGNTDKHPEPLESDPLSAIIALITRGGIMTTNEINAASEFDRIGIDSISFITMVVELEEHFSIEFEDDYLNYEKFETVGSFAEYVAERIREPQIIE
jgi:amino acid adenylation domain-containing protein